MEIILSAATREFRNVGKKVADNKIPIAKRERISRRLFRFVNLFGIAEKRKLDFNEFINRNESNRWTIFNILYPRLLNIARKVYIQL